jgi:hypothetical protein
MSAVARSGPAARAQPSPHRTSVMWRAAAPAEWPTAETVQAGASARRESDPRDTAAVAATLTPTSAQMVRAMRARRLMPDTTGHGADGCLKRVPSRRVPIEPQPIMPYRLPGLARYVDPRGRNGRKLDTGGWRNRGGRGRRVQPGPAPLAGLAAARPSADCCAGRSDRSRPGRHGQTGAVRCRGHPSGRGGSRLADRHGRPGLVPGAGSGLARASTPAEGPDPEPHVRLGRWCR